MKKEEEGAIETVWSNCHIPRRWTEERGRGAQREAGGWGGSQSSVRDLSGEAGKVGGGGEKEGRGGFFHTLTFVPPTSPFIGGVGVCVCLKGLRRGRGGDKEGRGG